VNPADLKSQDIRLLDVWLIGPVMIAGALRLPRRDNGLAWLLGIFGAATIVYNARNYQRYAELVSRSEA